MSTARDDVRAAAGAAAIRVPLSAVPLATWNGQDIGFSMPSTDITPLGVGQRGVGVIESHTGRHTKADMCAVQYGAIGKVESRN